MIISSYIGAQCHAFCRVSGGGCEFIDNLGIICLLVLKNYWSCECNKYCSLLKEFYIYYINYGVL